MLQGPDDKVLSAAVQAFILATPWAITARFPGIPGHCLPAAMGGAEALQTFGISARPIRCYALGFVRLADGRMSFCTCVGAGRTLKDVWDSVVRAGLSGSSTYEQFWAFHGDKDTGFESVHAIVEATKGSHQVLVDPTSSQMSGQLITVPNCLVWPTTPERWPGIGLRDAGGPDREGHIHYRAHPSDDIPAYQGADYHVIAADLVELMTQALQLGEAGFTQKMNAERWPTLQDGMGSDDSLWR